MALAVALVLVAKPVRLVELRLDRGDPFLGQGGGTDVGHDAPAAAAFCDLIPT